MEEIEIAIQKKLIEIEEKENIKILYAAESGSRAWGLASNDSDYDVRFIYLQEPSKYLQLNEKKDVIEWQLDKLFDINGWDLKKCLIQFQKSNATLFEWNNSPIVYRRTELWDQIYAVTQEYFSVKTVIGHYFGIAIKTYNQYLVDDMVNYKKYFYALRPLLALAYVKKYRCPPPILFTDLMESDLDPALKSQIEQLVALKKSNNEDFKGEQDPQIQRYIVEKIAERKVVLEGINEDRNNDWEKLNKLFCQILENNT
jgi:predicted nucleotidyltransferase